MVRRTIQKNRRAASTGRTAITPKGLVSASSRPTTDTASSALSRLMADRGTTHLSAAFPATRSIGYLPIPLAGRDIRRVGIAAAKVSNRRAGSVTEAD
jgi:hypothetical protein